MAKGRAKPVRLKPPIRDALGKAIDSWSESSWTGDKKKWSLNLFRVDNGFREEKKFEGTYRDMEKLRMEYLATGLYFKAVAKFGMPVGRNERIWG